MCADSSVSLISVHTRDTKTRALEAHGSEPHTQKKNGDRKGENAVRLLTFVCILRRRRQLRIPGGISTFHFLVISFKKTAKKAEKRRLYQRCYHSSHDATVTRDCSTLNNAYSILSILPHLILTYAYNNYRVTHVRYVPSVRWSVTTTQSGLDQNILHRTD